MLRKAHLWPNVSKVTSLLARGTLAPRSHFFFVSVDVLYRCENSKSFFNPTVGTPKTIYTMIGLATLCNVDCVQALQVACEVLEQLKLWLLRWVDLVMSWVWYLNVLIPIIYDDATPELLLMDSWSRLYQCSCVWPVSLNSLERVWVKTWIKNSRQGHNC